MNSHKQTKRALLTSVMALVMCVVMLVGTTFAWFTDTASTSVNTIKAGNLHVQIQDSTGKSIDTLKWVKADGTVIEKQESILWEPGCTYLLTPFKIVNTGNLALKYKIVVDGLDGNAKLLNVLTFTYTTENGKVFDMDAEGHLAANGGATDIITVSVHMDENAGNEYQNETLTGVKFTVVATQDTVEYDSTTKDYDAKATYPVLNESEFKQAIADAEEGDVILLQDDMSITNTGSYGSGTPDTYIIKKNVTIDLNGKTLTVNSNDKFMLAADSITIKNGKIAAGPASSTSTGKITYSLGVTSKAKNVLIENMEIEGGVEILGNGTTATLKNVKVTATNYYALYIAYGAKVTLEGGEFTANASGIHAYMDNFSGYYPACEIVVKGAAFSGGSLVYGSAYEGAGTVTNE